MAMYNVSLNGILYLVVNPSSDRCNLISWPTYCYHGSPKSGWTYGLLNKRKGEINAQTVWTF